MERLGKNQQNQRNQQTERNKPEIRGMTTKTNHLSLATYWSDRTTRGCIETGATTYRPTEQFRKVPNVAAALPSIGRGCSTSELGARERLDSALRTIAFMDAASLSGSRAWRSIFGGNACGMREGLHPSGFDHTEVWLWFGHRVVTTEPTPRHLAERQPQQAKSTGSDSLVSRSNSAESQPEIADNPPSPTPITPPIPLGRS